MKKLITITVLLTFAIFIAGCKKEETALSNLLSEQETAKSPGNFSRNPFDINHEYLMEMFQDVAKFLSTMGDNPDYEDYEIFMNDFENLIAKYNNNPYHEFDLAAFTSSDQKNMMTLLDDYMFNIEIIGFEEATKAVENNISLMRNVNVRQSMYSVVSQLKFTLEFLDIFTGTTKAPDGRPSSEERMINCLTNKANDLWDNGNTFDKVSFLATLPGSALRWMASCAWDVAFRPNLHWTSY